MIKLVAVLSLIAVSGFIKQTHTVIPPHLKTVRATGVGLYAGFRQPLDSAKVVTVKFQISETGFLDTLHVSPNAPTNYFGKIEKQLLDLNGRWNPQTSDGKPEKSKWLIYRHCVMGSNNRKAGVAWTEVRNTCMRDRKLFRCHHKLNRPMQCSTDYVEGPDFFLFPPELYLTYH